MSSSLLVSGQSVPCAEEQQSAQVYDRLVNNVQWNNIHWTVCRKAKPSEAKMLAERTGALNIKFP